MNPWVLKTYFRGLEEKLSNFLLQGLRNENLISIWKQVLIEFILLFLILFPFQVIEPVFIKRNFRDFP